MLPRSSRRKPRDLDPRGHAWAESTDEKTQLEQSLVQLESILEHLTEALVVADPRGRVLSMNKAALHLFGYARVEDAQATMEDLVAEWELFDASGRLLPPAERPMARVVAGERFTGMEVRMRRIEGGRDFWGSCSGTPIRSPEGEAQFCVVTVRDVTAEVENRRKLREANLALLEREEELAEAGRHRDEFIAMLGHELRNPLAVLRSAAELQRLHPDDPEVIARTAAVAERQTVQMSHLVDALLDASRILHGRLQIHRVPVDLASLARQVEEDFRPVARKREITLDVRTPGEPLTVTGDASRLRQVLGNLVDNGLKFTPAGGRVRLEVRRAAFRAVVSVRDTGRGMDEEVRRQAFEPFRQGEIGIDRREGGLGLGLAIARGLVELHGGRIRAQSPGPGCGTVVRLFLPIRGEAAPPPAAPAPALGTIDVLIVEDNADTANVLAELLAADGARVRVAHDGEAGLAIVRDSRPSVIFCDVGLPGALDGLGFAQAIRADPELAAVRLVAISGYGHDRDRRRGRAAGFDAYLVKPVGLDDVRRAMIGPDSPRL